MGKSDLPGCALAASSLTSLGLRVLESQTSLSSVDASGSSKKLQFQHIKWPIFSSMSVVTDQNYLESQCSRCRQHQHYCQFQIHLKATTFLLVIWINLFAQVTLKCACIIYNRLWSLRVQKMKLTSFLIFSLSKVNWIVFLGEVNFVISSCISLIWNRNFQTMIKFLRKLEKMK